MMFLLWEQQQQGDKHGHLLHRGHVPKAFESGRLCPPPPPFVSTVSLKMF